jgi:hypothetical protein
MNADLTLETVATIICLSWNWTSLPFSGFFTQTVTQHNH